MKVCKICRVEYSDDIEVCSKCSVKLVTMEEGWTTPQSYKTGY